MKEKLKILEVKTGGEHETITKNRQREQEIGRDSQKQRMFDLKSCQETWLCVERCSYLGIRVLVSKVRAYSSLCLEYSCASNIPWDDTESFFG